MVRRRKKRVDFFKFSTIRQRNRVGNEDKMTFSGKSFVTNPAGEVIGQSPAGQDDVLIVDIDLNEVQDSHARKLFFRDRRPDIYPL